MTSILSTLNNFKIKELQLREKENLFANDKIVFTKKSFKEIARNVNNLYHHMDRYLPYNKKEGKMNIKAMKKEI